MKKLLVIGLLALTSSAFAHGYGNHFHNHYNHGNHNWVAPLIVGGIIGYTINRIPPPPLVYVYNPPLVTIPTIQTQTCTAWIEVQNINGSITRTRTCTN